MGVDYYKILQVDRSAKDDDLKKAYTKLAMKWNLDKNPNNKKEAEAKLTQISEAYDVLIDPQKRQIYDQYGEEGLKGQVPRPDGWGAGGQSFFSPRGGGNPRKSDGIFDEFFGFSGPFGGTGGGGGSGMRGSTGGGETSFRSNPRNADDIFSEYFGFSSPSEGMGGGAGRGVGGFQSALRKGAPVEKKLPCTLEDLYRGTTKKMKVSREILAASGKTVPVEEILTISVKRGWKKGTRITFQEKGNEQPNQIPSDLVFTVDEKPHKTFTRDGDDLVVTQKISLAEALTGYTVQLTTLDGRNLTIPIDNMIHPNYEEVVPREGMPISKDPTRKGNLRIKFDVFPARLTASQKAGIRQLLGS